MSFSEEELQLHCETIIQSRRAQGKIVILCESGRDEVLKQKPRPTTTAYRKEARLSDALFYKACIPSWWEGGRPEFFVCGDRENVINTYFKLQEMHENEPNDSYLHKNKLFAIIDLDLQTANFPENYPFSNTEQLFETLYQQNIPQLEKIKQNQIFITGLIYKEAYFLIPDLQSLFDNYHQSIVFNDNSLNLESVYQVMIENLSTDENLLQNFQRACDRINDFDILDFTNISTLQESWLQAFHTANKLEKDKLIYALLTMHQVKNYWKAFKPSDNDIIETRFKEQLILEIGKFYAQQPRNSQHHLPSFFNALLENS